MKHKSIAFLKEKCPPIASAASRAYAISRYFKNRAIVKGIVSGDASKCEYISVKEGQPIAYGQVAERLAGGDVIIARNLLSDIGLFDAADKLMRRHYGMPIRQLDTIHEQLPPLEIMKRTEKLKLAPELLRLETGILMSLFANQDELFVELMPNLRPHIPYKTALAYERQIESTIGRGKMNAHGPHKDSWRYHPNNTINVWVGLSPVTRLNGMFVLPDSRGYYPKFAANEISSGCETYPDRQYLTELDAGDAVLFSAELLHGSILNQTEKTRFAFSMRCTFEKPDFHRKFMYDYVRVLPSFSNLIKDKMLSKSTFEPKSSATYYAQLGKPTQGLDVVEMDERRMIVRTPSGLAQFPRRCPHKSVDLQYGRLEGDCLVCPQHQLRIKKRHVAMEQS